MTKRMLLPTLFGTLLFSGCVSNNAFIPSNLNQNSHPTKKLIFKTNTSTILNQLNAQSTKEERNLYMDEFFLKSDMQCKQYLDSPVMTNNPTDDATTQLYIGIFDTISMLFGVKGITDSAKAVYKSSDISNIENKKEYENALSPEIKYGVEVTRTRYAIKMNSKKNLSIKEYSTSQLEEDMNIYDKQCSEEYGLIEINRALKAMQQNINQPRTVTKINPNTIKDKVTKVTKKVKEKKEKKMKEKEEKANCNAILRDNQ